jgi:hypothetical protein
MKCLFEDSKLHKGSNFWSGSPFESVGINEKFVNNYIDTNIHYIYWS